MTGRLIPEFHDGIPGDTRVATGRVRRLQLVEQVNETTESGSRFVEGTERVRNLGASRDRYWPDWFRFHPDNSLREAGVVVDLALDDVPDPVRGFEAGAVDIHGSDVWVMDRSAPVLLHVDASRSPVPVTEYLLPLAFEPLTPDWSRTVHADGEGCWITCSAEIVRCDRTGPGEVTVRLVTSEGGNYTTMVDGRLFALTQHVPSVRSHDRYGTIRFDPAPHPVRELVAGVLLDVDDEDTIALARAHSRRADRAPAPDGITWIADGGLSVRTPDGTAHPVDLSGRTRGTVHWIRPDPMEDPAIAELLDPLQFPPVEEATGSADSPVRPDPIT